MNSVSSVTGKKKRGGSVVGSLAPLCYFLQLFTLSMVEKSLRTKFREVLSQAAVPGVLPG